MNTGVFDLTENDDDILGAQDPTMFIIKYYETLLDSQNDTNVIPGPTVHLLFLHLRKRFTHELRIIQGHVTI